LESLQKVEIKKSTPSTPSTPSIKKSEGHDGLEKLKKMKILKVRFKDDLLWFFKTKDQIVDYLNFIGKGEEEVVEIEEFFIKDFKPDTIVDALNSATCMAIAEEEQRQERKKCNEKFKQFYNKHIYSQININ